MPPEAGALIAGIVIGVIIAIWTDLIWSKFSKRRAEKRRSSEVAFKRTQLRPTEKNVSSEAQAEEDRPHAKQTRVEYRPRAGRKRS